MLTHDEIMKLKLVRFPDGDVVSVDEEAKTGEVVFNPGAIHPEYVNLLRGAATLYQTLHYQGVALQQLVEMCKAMPGAEGIIPTFEQMQSSVEFAIALAEHGPETFIGDLKQ